MNVKEGLKTCNEELEPGVIDSDMIIKAVLQNSPKGEVGRLIAEEGIVLEEINELRLEYLNILRIDHLWMLNSLVKLHISNNMIEKIENLERLENLIELDLSFNNIEIIENLGTLVNLEVLTVFENKISKLENMENLTSLMIFSVGNNKLEELGNVMYLRPFENLRALNMAGNPIAQRDYFKEYIYAVLPQLVYYEYRMITQTEREMANVRFKEDLKDLIEVEGKGKEQYILSGKERELIQLYTDAFIEDLNSDKLFTQMFKFDPEGLAFLKMNEDAEELFVEFKDKFIGICNEMFEFGLSQHTQRREEIDQYESAVIEAKDTVMTKSRDLMNEFIEAKSEIFRKMRAITLTLQHEAEGEGEETNEADITNLRQLATEFQELSHSIWQNLMRMEMDLYEQIDDATSNFEVCIRELREQFVEGSQSFFVKLRDEEGTYFEQMSDIALRYLNNINVRLGDPSLLIEMELKTIMVDRDTMASALSGSHEAHLQTIDDRQDTMVTRATKWTDDYTEKLRKDEITRNRGKIVEISHFMDLQQEEYDEILSATDIHIDEHLDIGDEDLGTDFEEDLDARVRRSMGLGARALLSTSDEEGEECDEEEEGDELEDGGKNREGEEEEVGEEGEEYEDDEKEEEKGDEEEEGDEDKENKENNANEENDKKERDGTSTDDDVKDE